MLAERLGSADMTNVSDQPLLQGLVAVQPGSKDTAGSVGAFGADTAHELANLVLVMSGSLEQLRRQPLDEQGQRQLARAEWSVRQAAQLTRRVLSQAQGGDDRPEIVDLNAADAMPDGGRVNLQTHGPRLDSLGDQVAIEVSVSDNRTSVPTAVDVFVTARLHDKNTELGRWMVDRLHPHMAARSALKPHRSTAPRSGSICLTPGMPN